MISYQHFMSHDPFLRVSRPRSVSIQGRSNPMTPTSINDMSNLPMSEVDLLEYRMSLLSVLVAIPTSMLLIGHVMWG